MTSDTKDYAFTFAILVGGLAIGAAAGAGTALSLKGSGTSPSNTNPENPSATCSIGSAEKDSGKLFSLDNKVISRDDLTGEQKDALYQIENQAHESKSLLFKEMALRMALSGKSLQNLPDLKTLVKVTPASESELKSFYTANKDSLPPGATFEQLKPQIENYLMAQSVGTTAKKKIQELESKGRLILHTVPPAAPVVEWDLSSYPSQGNAKAKVTLVEVSDYMCPHCRHFQEDVHKIIKKYGNKIRFVQINFPLDPQGLSGALVKGGFCAQKQGVPFFWKYHERAFEIPFDAMRPVSTDAQKEYLAQAEKIASDVGMDTGAFSKCLASSEAGQSLTQVTNAMKAVGVTGTPTFFMNNKKISLSAGKNLEDALQEYL